MTEMNDIVVLRGIIKANPDLRTEVLNSLSALLNQRGFELGEKFLEGMTIASAEEISASGLHVVELDWSNGNG
uniref:Uncharacterized protein n=1 Tax=Candidatus Kentrum sp. UNK TaxID=2126344 RepID=A0A451AGZ9_9GAMM|nr:MAG: hypothetical protein BECKUNK1418G_GA0071005_10607 [Candidatus Kentron sp. UNK]VFK71397.1 MAG: hypothetical protein BECKUNK1418H_GA0071006_10647 [Candidatus Kentron sp. UNK]